MSTEHRVRGTITLVQEQRFQLVDDNGVAHLFLLAHDVSLTPSQLRTLAYAGRRVEVHYKHCSDLVAALATGIDDMQTEEALREETADGT